MNNLKYIIAGIIVGGGLGAKVGEYLATLLGEANTWQWVQSSLLVGCLTGLVLTMAILIAVTDSTKEESYNFSQRNENSPLGTA